MRILTTILLITISTNAHAFYKWVTPENITGQAKAHCNSVDIHRRFNDLGNVINCGLYLNPKQQNFYVKNIQGRDMAKGWRDGEHSVRPDNSVAMADAELQISSPCAVITLDIPVKPIEISGWLKVVAKKRDNANNVHHISGRQRQNRGMKHKKPATQKRSTPTPPPLGNVHGTTTYTR